MLLVAVASVSLVVELELRKSREAVAAGDLVEALSYAHAARSLAPWAATPRLQSALVREELDELAASRSEIEAAIRLDPQDWRFWLIRARIETKLGAAKSASRSLRRATELNPRSQLLRGVSER